MKPLYLALAIALAGAWLTGSIDSPVPAKCDRLSALPWLRCVP